MNFLKKISALTLSVFFIIISVIIFSVYLFNISINSDFTELKYKDANNQISIYENYNGIPHIKAITNKDLFFAMGFQHAKDRLWQMDIVRRAAEGRLSEIFGERTFKQDLFLRCLDLKNYANNSLKDLSDTSASILESYSNGVNFYIKNYSDKLTFEFGALDYKPDEWKPYHCILISKMLTFEMSFSFWFDYLYSSLSEEIGISKSRNLLPASSPPYIFENVKSTPSQNDNVKTNNIKLPSFNGNLYSNLFNNFGNGFSGSNAWAVTFQDRKTKHAMIANDTHLPINIPSRWYQIHLTSDNYNAIGYSIPGLPLIISGRNDYISWGITNMMADVCDIFLVKNGRSDDYYISKEGKEIEYEFIRDTIKIKNDEDYQYYQKRTEISPLLSDKHLWNDDSTNVEFFEKYNISFDWTNKIVSDEFLSLYNINQARDFDTFKNALNNWNAPVLLFHYADTTGNIGIVPAGNIPIRKNTDPNFINPYWKSENHWNGFINTSELSYTYTDNPGKYVYSANNPLFDDSDIFISNYWEPNSRAKRIEQLLNKKSTFTIRDFEYMQMDQYSPYSKQLLKLTLPILIKAEQALSNNQVAALNKLINWNNILARDVNEAIIYNYFKRFLIEDIYKDDLKTLYIRFVKFVNIPDIILLQHLKNDDVIFFDNKLTENIKENKELIVVHSFKRAIDTLINQFGINGIRTKKYSSIRKLPLNHYFGQNKFIAPSVNLEPLPVGGDNTTLFNTETSYNNPNNVKISSSMRLITDMADTNIYMIMPGGASGDPANFNYGDQVQLWLNGGYIKLSTTNKVNKNFKLKTLIKPN